MSWFNIIESARDFVEIVNSAAEMVRIVAEEVSDDRNEDSIANDIRNIAIGVRDAT